MPPDPPSTCMLCTPLYIDTQVHFYYQWPLHFLFASYATAVPPPLRIHLDEESISVEEIAKVIKHTKSKSSPSPLNRIPYQVLKRCPSLLPALFNLYNSCWESGEVPLAWKLGAVRLIPKSSATEDPRRPQQPWKFSAHCINIMHWESVHYSAEESMACIHA